MASPPNRTELVDAYPNPSTGVFKNGLGKFYDYVYGLLGATGNAAQALIALGAAALNSPTFTGTPSAPTPAAADNTTKLATTAWAKLGFALVIGGTASYIKLPDWMGGLVVQWGSTVATSDGSAQVAFPFPLTFPSAVYTHIAFVGDNGDNKTHVFGSTATSTTTARFVLIDSTNGAGRPAFVVRLNWVAFGK